MKPIEEITSADLQMKTLKAQESSETIYGNRKTTSKTSATSDFIDQIVRGKALDGGLKAANKE